jgi:hypothetical protein
MNRLMSKAWMIRRENMAQKSSYTQVMVLSHSSLKPKIASKSNGMKIEIDN